MRPLISASLRSASACSELSAPGAQRHDQLFSPSPGRFMIKSTVSGASGLFLLHNMPAPYQKFSGMIDAIPDSDLRRFALAQCCWLSIDAITKTANGPEAYRFIGAALAQLATDDAAVLLHPTHPIAMSLDPLNRQRIAAGLQPD